MDANDFPTEVGGLLRDALQHEAGRLVAVVYRMNRLRLGAWRHAPLAGVPFTVRTDGDGAYAVHVGERPVATGAGVGEALRLLRAAFDRECVRVRVSTASAAPAPEG